MLFFPACNAALFTLNPFGILFFQFDRIFFNCVTQGTYSKGLKIKESGFDVEIGLFLLQKDFSIKTKFLTKAFRALL